MKIKSFIFGLGCGLMILSVFFYFIYTYNGKQPSEAAQISDADVAERAKQLGMVYLTEAANHTEKTALSDDEIIGLAAKLGMVFIIDEQPPSDNEASTDEVNEETNDEEILKEELPKSEEKSSDEQTQAPVAAAIAAFEKNDDGTILVNIPRGFGATEVAARLYNAGVIDDKAAFLKFIYDNGATKKLAFGSYYFYEDEEFEEILDKMQK